MTMPMALHGVAYLSRIMNHDCFANTAIFSCLQSFPYAIKPIGRLMKFAQVAYLETLKKVEKGIGLHFLKKRAILYLFLKNVPTKQF